MKKLIFSIIIFFAASSSFAADSAPNFIAAKVNNKAITNSELLDRFKFVLIASKIKIQLEQDKKMLLAQVLDKMIDEELIRQEAENLKIDISPAEVQEALEIMAAQRKQNATQLKLFFMKNNLSFDNYLKQIESEVLWSKIISEALRGKVKVTEFEVKELFEQHKFSTDVKKFLVAEVVILKSKNAAQLAQKLTVELRHGADFKNIVKQFSGSITSENNGELGWVSQGEIDAKIYMAISKLGKGSYSDPVLLGDGYHIFKLLDAKTETKIADHDLNAARNMIFSYKLQSVAKGYLMDLRKKSFIEINHEKLGL